MRYAALAHAFNPTYAHSTHRERANDMAREASRLIAHQEGRRKHDSLLREMKEDAQARAGEFAHLSRAPVDHTPALNTLLDELLNGK